MIIPPLFYLGFILAKAQPYLPYFFYSFVLGSDIFRLIDDSHILSIWKNLLQYFYFLGLITQDLR